MELSQNVQNNKLIRRVIRQMYPASFASALTLSIHLMTDSILAGYFFEPKHIAAIGIGMPLQMLLCSITTIFICGMMLKMSTCIGRGDSVGAQRTFSISLQCSVTLSVLFMLIMLIFAEPLVQLYGARDAETIALAAKYSRFYSPFIVCSTIGASSDMLLKLYGLPNESFKMSLVKMVVNLVLSVLLVKLTDLGIAGLGLGSVIAEALAGCLSIRRLIVKKVGLKIELVKFKLREMIGIIKLGLPSSLDMIIDSLVSGVVNNIIATALGGIAISYYAVVNGIVRIAGIASQASSMTSSPLFGLLYGARDKNGMKRAFRYGNLLGLIMTVVWGAVIIVCLPLLLKFYGMDAPDMAAIIRPGVYIGIIMIAALTLNRMFSSFFEATERFTYALAFSLIADSVLFPLTLPFMIRLWGYTGVWLGKGICIIFTLILYYIIIWARGRERVPSSDSLLKISDDLRENAPKLDITISADNANASGISERINAFLVEYGAKSRTAYMAALCTEELAADFIEHSKNDGRKRDELMDVKLFVDENSVTTIIRNDAAPYNPLDFEMDDETFSKMGVVLVQKVAKKIEYNYMYRMNVVTIVLAK